MFGRLVLVGREAASAQTGGQRTPLGQAHRQHGVLPRLGAQLLASVLVGDVARAVRVPVRDEDTFAVHVDHRRVFEQGHPCFGSEPLAEQEVAVAVHDVRGEAPSGLGERVANRHRRGLVVVVADPNLDQVAQDVERVYVVAHRCQELLQSGEDVRTGGVDVQVRDEKRGHGRVGPFSTWLFHARGKPLALPG